MCSASVSNGDCNIFNPPSFVHVLVGNLPLQNGEKRNGENFIKDTLSSFDINIKYFDLFNFDFVLTVVMSLNLALLFSLMVIKFDMLYTMIYSPPYL